MNDGHLCTTCGIHIKAGDVCTTCGIHMNSYTANVIDLAERQREKINLEMHRKARLDSKTFKREWYGMTEEDRAIWNGRGPIAALVRGLQGDMLDAYLMGQRELARISLQVNE